MRVPEFDGFLAWAPGHAGASGHRRGRGQPWHGQARNV